MDATKTVTHKITWWVYAGTERIRRNAQMRGQWGYDATCTCGWDSKTGGAVRGSVQRDVDDHKHDVTGVDPSITRIDARLDRLHAETAALLADLDAR